MRSGLPPVEGGHDSLHLEPRWEAPVGSCLPPASRITREPTLLFRDTGQGLLPLSPGPPTHRSACLTRRHRISPEHCRRSPRGRAPSRCQHPPPPNSSRSEDEETHRRPPVSSRGHAPPAPEMGSPPATPHRVHLTCTTASACEQVGHPGRPGLDRGPALLPPGLPSKEVMSWDSFGGTGRETGRH